MLTIGLKTGAYWVTGSVGLLSDALESGANLATALLAFLVLRIASRPPDQEHAHGHEKTESFSSGAEGAAILIAAGAIVLVGIRRLFLPQPLAQLDLGLLMSLLATLVNFAAARILSGIAFGFLRSPPLTLLYSSLGNTLVLYAY